jgi:hypothetical protein
VTAPQSPWMTTAEAATYARCHPTTIRKAFVDYAQSSGSRGVRSLQRGPNSPHLVHVDDLTRWMAGEAPARGVRKLRSA